MSLARQTMPMSGAENRYGTRSAKPQSKNLDNPDETLAFPKGAASSVRLGDLVVGRLVQQFGWRWSEQVKPIADESRQFHHIGVGLSGSAMIRMDDGSRWRHARATCSTSRPATTSG